MLTSTQKNKLVAFVLLLAVSAVSSEDGNITISLNKTLTVTDKELFSDFVTVNSYSTLRINVISINKKVDYIIFQVHSHLNNVTVYNNTLVRQSSVDGTNVGLFGTVKPPDIYYILNKNALDLKLYISIHGYRASDPVPGGCNMESHVPISPFMHLSYTQNMILVDAPPASDPADKDCLGVGSKVEVAFYRMYLKERDFTENSYFQGLQNMMTLDKIMENGHQVPLTVPKQQQRRFLSAYPGTGEVYVAVAYMTNNPSLYSIYVPIHTYACSPSEGCRLLDDFVSQTFCVALIFIGFFLCFFGHRFFKTEMFLVGMFAGIIITYILISLWTDLERPVLLSASLLSGSFFGAIWILLWWFYGIPVLSVALVTMHLGFVAASIIYHCAPGGNALFANDGRFWTVFVLIMFCSAITLTTISYLANIICCAILGAYAVVFAIDHYIGSNLKYIVINTVRRAVVKNFSYTVLALPYQWPDAILTVLWLALATAGILFQHFHNRGRPPFPPPPRSMNRMLDPITYGTIGNRERRRQRYLGISNGVHGSVIVANERTPLINGANE